VSGPLAIRRGVTLWIDEGVTLFASRDPRQYDRSASSCGVVSDNSKGCKPLFMVKDVTDAGIVGKGRIDGRGGEPLLDDTRTWWDIAQEAKRTNGKQSVPRLIEVERARAFTLYQITLNNSPNFHVVLGAVGFVVWGVTVQTPSFAKNSLGWPLSARYARNTDGIDPSGASNGFIVHSRISVGDDHIAIKANKTATTDLVIAHNHFGIGHGMSIGSETVAGVRNIRVHDLSIDGDVQNGASDEYEKDHSGLRIKSSADRGGLVTGVVYTDVCMRDVPVPIHITSAYAHNTEGGKPPLYQGIVFHNVRSVQGRFSVEPQVKLLGLDATHRLSVRFDNVVIDGASLTRTEAGFARIALGPGPVNLQPAGEAVDVKHEVTSAAPPFSCENRFVPFEVR
jgi:polygalacturonase